MNNVQKAIQAIRAIDNNADLNLLVEAFKLQRTFLTRQVAVTFRVGDRVSFAARGMQVLGTVTKVNIKTIQVKQDNSFTNWKVTASLLKPVKEMTTA
tara:strand:+ start:167 stop:457 length:291 start_codon:yes stop_codon:yes gene_type:complete